MRVVLGAAATLLLMTSAPAYAAPCTPRETPTKPVVCITWDDKAKNFVATPVEVHLQSGKKVHFKCTNCSGKLSIDFEAGTMVRDKKNETDDDVSAIGSAVNDPQPAKKYKISDASGRETDPTIIIEPSTLALHPKKLKH